MSRVLMLVIALAACSNAMALRDDVLIVVNDNSIDSPQLGAYYAQQRGIDPANIVHVRVPNSYFNDWAAFRSLRDQLIAFMQANTMDDPALTPVVCTDGEPPHYCPAAMAQLGAHTKIRYLVTTRGVPTRMVVDGSPLYAPAAPTSVDNYLKYWLINYFAEDIRLKFPEREAAFGDGRGMRTVLPAADRELIIGRIDGLNLASAQALLDRTLAAERRGVYGRLFGSTRFNRWVDHSSGRLIYPPAGIIGWPYQLGLFGEARAECVDYLDVSGALPEGKAPSHCRVQLNEDSDPVTSADYPAPGNAGSRQPQAVDALLYQGWLDGQAAAGGNFDALLNWRKDDQCAVTECRDAADPEACRTASTDVFRELNSDCVGVAEGFMGYNHQSFPASYLAVWPTGWFQSTSNSSWNNGGTGDVNQLAFPEVRTDSGFDDSFSLWFRNTDQVADPRCYPDGDFSVAPSLSCLDQRRVVLTQRLPLAERKLDINNPQTYRIAFRYQAANIAIPASLRVSFFVHETGDAQINYGSSEVATLVPGSSDWTLAEAQFQLDPALHTAASYDGIKFRIETAGVFAGELGIDTVSVLEAGAGIELGINGSFSEGHRQAATGDHAATFLDRLGGVAFWGSVSHHQSVGCAFCLSGMAPLVYFLRGLPLGDAVWFDASNNSGILYGDPLYSPVAVRLNPVNDSDTLSGVVDLYGSTLNGRDAAQVETSYAIDVCPGDDFLVCDQEPGAWQSTGIRGVGGAQTMRLGSWDSSGVAPGSYTLRLSVTSLNTVSGRSQTLYDYYPLTVEPLAPPPPAGSLQFSALSFSGAEQADSVLITVTRTGGSAGAVSVDYATGDDSAMAGRDYLATSATLNFVDGAAGSQTFSVPLLDDTVFEGDERFTLRLSNMTGGASLGTPATASVTITENDSPPGDSNNDPPPVDSNGDGISDADAIALGLDPTDPDGDTDNDGVSDILELGMDPGHPLDSDVDGVIDALEPGATAADAAVASQVPLGGGVSATITTAAGEALTGISVAAANGGPTGINFPFGMLSYTTSSPVGGSVTVRMSFSTELPANLSLFKVGNGSVFTELPGSVWRRADARSVDVTLTDGDPVTDLDGAANGSIDDPVALGEVVPVTGGSVSGGGGGCALNPSASEDPTLLFLILLSLGYWFRRCRPYAIVRRMS